jgi:Uma2 family endonuclease
MPIVQSILTPVSPTPVVGLPPLENGDRMTRAEFERRWERMPHLKRAELIEGEVFMNAALRLNQHGRPQLRLITWLGIYINNTPGIDGGDNTSVRLDLDNMPQPDGCLLLPVTSGSTARVSEDGYVEGAPDLVAEVSASSTSIDLHRKLQVYRRNGVREYIVWRVLDKAIDWFVLHEGDYVALPPDEHGSLKSRLFPGLWLDPTALIRNQRGNAFEALQRGMASPEHAEFVRRLTASES